MREQGYLIERTRRGKRGNPKFYFLKLSSPEIVFSMPVRKAHQKKTEKTLVVRKDGSWFTTKTTKKMRKTGRFSIASIDLE